MKVRYQLVPGCEWVRLLRLLRLLRLHRAPSIVRQHHHNIGQKGGGWLVGWWGGVMLFFLGGGGGVGEHWQNGAYLDCFHLPGLSVVVNSLNMFKYNKLR